MITRKQPTITPPAKPHSMRKTRLRGRRGTATPMPPDPVSNEEDAIVESVLGLDTSVSAAEELTDSPAAVRIKEAAAPPVTVTTTQAEARPPLPASNLSATPLDLPVEVFQAGLARRQRNRQSLLEWLRSALVDGTDYGRLHILGKDRCGFAKRGEAAQCPDPNHWSKPSLFKPGAEKICGMLGVTVHFPSLPSYEQAGCAGQPLPVIVLRCELHDSQGRTVAEGIGARSLQQDYGDLNKTLKMASKSAHIDATLRLAGLSEVFTQDLEEAMLNPERQLRPRSENNNGHGSMNPSEADSPSSPPVTVSRTQLRYLDQRIKALGLERERVLRWIRRASRGQLQTFTDLTPELYERLLPKLERWAKAPTHGGNGTPVPTENGRNARGRR